MVIINFKIYTLWLTEDEGEDTQEDEEEEDPNLLGCHAEEFGFSFGETLVSTRVFFP